MRLVLCHGCFDILHAGHFEHFRAAREFGDRLVVSITAARWVHEAKGDGHPAHTDEERLMQLRDVRTVDEAWICDDPTAVPAILLYKPAFYVKGVDYAARGINPKEQAACDAVGAKVVYTNTTKRSVIDFVAQFKSQQGGE